MARAIVFPIEIASVLGVQHGCEPSESAEANLQQNVIVVCHETPGKEHAVVLLQAAAKNPQELFSIVIVTENVLLSNATRSDVVDVGCGLLPRYPAHTHSYSLNHQQLSFKLN